MFSSRDTGKLYNSRSAMSCEQVRSASGGGNMKDTKPDKREESPWVAAARYSEIGFMIPAAVMVGYLMGLGADHLLHTHWLYTLGIIFGAVVGFVQMIRRAMRVNADEAKEEAEEKKDGR